MDIPTLTWVQKGHISCQKSLYNLLKNVPLKLYFQHEGHWYDNSLFYILTTYRKCVLFQFLCYGIRVQILILKRVHKRHISG